MGKSVLVNHPELLIRHIKNLRGGSQSILAQASDGLVYVVKFTNNLQGPNVCFNEGAGNELYRAFGLKCPSWKPLLVTDSFLDRNPNCWMQTPVGRLRPEAGLCFGSRFLGGEGVALLEILPGTAFNRVRNPEAFWIAWLIDICAEHADNRQAIFLEDDTHGLDAFFVDMGHLFGGPKGELRPKLLASCYLDQRIYRSVCSQHLMRVKQVASCLDVDRLWRRIESLPDNWKTPSALNVFNHCLGKFSNSGLIQSTIEQMMETQEEAHGSEFRHRERGRKPSVSVLRPGVQVTEFESACATKYAYRPCA